MTTPCKYKTWETNAQTTITRLISGRSNVFLIQKGNSNILIDTSPRRYWNKLNSRLKKLHINKLDCLILTHSHFDHADNAALIKEKYLAKVIIHKSEASNLKNGDFVMLKGTMLLSKFIVKILNSNISPVVRCRPCIPDILVEDFYDLRDYGLNAKIIHTPGHTKGSVSIIIDDEIAIVGDAMFGVFRNSIMPPFADDKNLMIKSWARLLQTNCNLFLPSHGASIKRKVAEKAILKFKMYD